MKRVSLWAATVLVAALTGCDTTYTPRTQEEASTNMWMVDTIGDAAIKNAIVAQRTLFPYHFVADSDQLNDLGLRDLGVLTQHFAGKGGQINVQRGDTAQDLYEVRLATVRNALAKAGLQSEKVALADSLPAGEGAYSDRVIRVMARDATPGTIYPPQQAIGASLKLPGQL